MTFPFDIIPHTIPAAHLREYMKGQANEDEDLYLCIKQYVPRATKINSSKNLLKVTIIAAGGTGFIKELYEPLFADLLSNCEHADFKVRSIWIADPVHTGASGVKNRKNLGYDSNWWDHARDLSAMVNHFRRDMVRPIVGLAHSMGANQLVRLSNIHPRLFTSLALIEAGIDPYYGRGVLYSWANATLRKKDSFETREEAEKAILENRQLKGWDQRVVANMIEYGIYPNEDHPKKEWKLTMSPQMEVTQVHRMNTERVGFEPEGIESITLAQRINVPDIDPEGYDSMPCYRPEVKAAVALLPGLRPWVLYINGGSSPFFGRTEMREERARITGTGVGGSGGMKLGTVEQVVIPGGQHTMTFDDNIPKISAHVAEWMSRELKRWKQGEELRYEEWKKTKLEDKQAVPQPIVQAARQRPSLDRPKL